LATPKATLEAFIDADLPAAITKVTVAADNVFIGQFPRVQQAKYEVLIRYLRREPMPSKTGTRRRYFFEIVVSVKGLDAAREEDLADEAADVASEIVDRYDGNGVGVFRAAAALSALEIEQTSAMQRTLTVDKTDRRAAVRRRMVVVDLRIDLWE